MPFLFDRVVEVIVDDTLVKDLRVEFKVEKSLKKQPNTAEITITNLSQNTRAGMQRKGAKVILRAGYPGTLAQIFSGSARTLDHIHVGPDWRTVIKCGDGETQYQFARANESFKGGTTVVQVLRYLVKSMGLGLGNSEQEISGIADQFVHGYTAKGNSAKLLSKMLNSFGREWSMQDGQVQILTLGESTKETVVSLSPDSGLIGSPEMGTKEQKGQFEPKAKFAVLKAKSLLQADIRPGRRVDIQSDQHKGTFRVIKLVHHGDTAGGDWYTEIEATPT